MGNLKSKSKEREREREILEYNRMVNNMKWAYNHPQYFLDPHGRHNKTSVGESRSRNIIEADFYRVHKCYKYSKMSVHESYMQSHAEEYYYNAVKFIRENDIATDNNRINQQTYDIPYKNKSEYAKEPQRDEDIKTTKLMYINKDEKLKEEFRKRIIGRRSKNKKYKYRDISYIANMDNMVKEKNSDMEKVVSPYDPYILMLADIKYNKIMNEYNYSDVKTNDSKKLYHNILNIELSTQYINYITNTNNKYKHMYSCVNFTYCNPTNNSFIKEVVPNYYNTIMAWKSILVAHRIYMEAWKKNRKTNGIYRRMFGEKCKPFYLNLAVMDKNVDLDAYGISYIYDILSGDDFEDDNYLDDEDLPIFRACTIKRNRNGLPNFNSVKSIINNIGDDAKLVFYINNNDIKQYIEYRKHRGMMMVC